MPLVTTQTIGENTFDQFFRWRTSGRWLSQWDSFNLTSAKLNSHCLSFRSGDRCETLQCTSNDRTLDRGLYSNSQDR